MGIGLVVKRFGTPDVGSAYVWVLSVPIARSDLELVALTDAHRGHWG